MAVSLQPTLLLHDAELRAKCHELLVKFNSYLLADRSSIRNMGRRQLDYWHDGVPLEIVPATRMLCESLAVLVQAGTLPLLAESEVQGELTAPTFLDHVIDVLGGVSRDAVQCLRRLRLSDTPLGPETVAAADEAGAHQPAIFPEICISAAPGFPSEQIRDHAASEPLR